MHKLTVFFLCGQEKISFCDMFNNFVYSEMYFGKCKPATVFVWKTVSLLFLHNLFVNDPSCVIKQELNFFSLYIRHMISPACKSTSLETEIEIQTLGNNDGARNL